MECDYHHIKHHYLTSNIHRLFDKFDLTTTNSYAIDWLINWLEIMFKLILWFTAFLSYNQSSIATDFYIDPINGSQSGDGSAEYSWLTLQQVIDDGLIETRDWQSKPPVIGETPLITINAGAPIKAGDTLWLKDGYHGAIDISGAYNSSEIIIKALSGHTPQVAFIKLIAVQNWVFDGLSVSPAHSNDMIEQGTLFSIRDFNFQGPSWDITLQNSQLFSIDDASLWTANQWINDTYSGVSVRSQRVKIINNTIKNVRFGITVNAAHATISHNTIDGFSADGIRGLGDHALYEYNLVQNCFVTSAQGDSNHDDGFQSWSFGDDGVGSGEVIDVVLRGNRFINYTDPNHPLNATMQGIGCFDGNFVNWRVENNIVVTDHWHGISFYGMIDSSIVNNTVLDLNNTSPGPPWITLEPSSTSMSHNVIVRNNLSTRFELKGQSITDDHNMIIDNHSEVFANPPYQLNLAENSAAIDQGNSAQAPDIDIDGTVRPIGNGHDIGAYEYLQDHIFVNGFE